MQRKKKLVALLLVTVLLVTTLLAGCGSSKDATKADSSKEHEALTMMTYTGDYENFEKALKEAYPEINIEFVSYRGKDSTDYGYAQLKAGDITDIFVTSMPPKDEQLQVDNFIDLSGEDFMSNLNVSLLSDVTVDGAVYMVPSNVSIFATYYNKTLFEKNGWKVPNSLEELEQLVPKIKEAGLTVAEALTQYLGASFSYFVDTSAPGYLTTLDGIEWMNNYIDGKATAKGNLEGSVKNFQKLIELGMLDVGDTPENDSETLKRFQEGNTAFLMANTSLDFTQNEDGTGDEYGIMPYLSENGDNNIIITKVSSYFGISKALENDEQKLEDAKKVMAFIATPEGQNSLAQTDNTISPLKNESVSEDSPLYEASKLVDEGQSMSLVYTGWEDYITGIGQDVFDMMKGDMTGDEFIKALDALQKSVVEQGGLETLAKVEEDLSKQQVAQLVGAAYADATNADCALISVGDFHAQSREENEDGVNGKLYAKVKLDTNVVCTVNPLGWTDTIKLMTLTGAQIKQYAKDGYYVDGDETPFEYVLVTKAGETLEDNKTYKVACVTESEERAKEGNLKDSEVIGQDAIVAYLKQLGTVNSETIVWKK